jgi:hypothetical protein
VSRRSVPTRRALHCGWAAAAGRERYVLAGAADARGLMRAADFMTMR